MRAFHIEKEVLSKVQSDGLISMRKAGMTIFNQNQAGVLILENCSKGCLIDLMTTFTKYAIRLISNKPPEFLVMLVTRDILRGLVALHEVYFG